MTETEFCYWLMGYFELRAVEGGTLNQVPRLEADQVACIRRHVQLVLLRHDGVLSTSGFVAWVAPILDLADTEPLDARTTQAIRRKLESHFEHVVDPAAKVDAAKANAAHSVPKWDRPPGARC